MLILSDIIEYLESLVRFEKKLVFWEIDLELAFDVLHNDHLRVIQMENPDEDQMISKVKKAGNWDNK